MKKSLRSLPPEACGLRPTRRTAIRQVGGWTIYLGALGLTAGCGRTPLGDPLGEIFPGDDDDATTTGTPTATPTVTPTPDPCICSPVSGSPLGINISSIPVNAFAISGGQNLFLCHDSAGFYAMYDRCVHNENMTENGSSYNASNLNGGFVCSHQGTVYNGNGVAQGPPAPAGFELLHYLLTIDVGGQLYVDITKIVDKDCRCTP